MKCLSIAAFVIAVLGALNWGLWGFFQFDMVAWLCGGNTNGLSRLVYAIIGLSGAWSLRIFRHLGHLCCCNPKAPCNK
jgi:hypothetical protein